MNYILPTLLSNASVSSARIFTKEIDQLAMQISDYCIATLDSSAGFTLGKDNVVLSTDKVFYARRAPTTCKDAQYFLAETKRITLAIGNLDSMTRAAQIMFPDGWAYILGLTDKQTESSEYIQAVQRKYSLVTINNFLRTNQLHLSSLREVQTRQLLKGINPDFTINEPCRGMANKWHIDDSKSKPYKSLFNK